MFDQLGAAIAAAPRMKLPELAALVWRAYAAGHLEEHQAQGLAEEIRLRQVLPPAPPPAPRRVGSRPRSPASIERRRRWCGSGWLPPQLAARFTLAEVAVLAVVASEVARKGRCDLALDHIAALAGVARTSVRNAMREARRLGLISVQLRPARAWRSDTNVVLVVDSAWRSWISMRRSTPGGVGANQCAPRGTDIFSGERNGSAQAVRPGSPPAWRGRSAPPRRAC